ncbi:MAG: proline--tRNA ligase [Peptoniphilus sp.]|nr:proline--tRNA ligase [Peptoniphilus sp.]MDY3118337.1 proline--tRNA ligase [Peptoniphilus sp.]
MAEEKFVREITPRDEDFAQWYTDIVLKAEMADYAPIRGCMVIRPYGFAVWENIKNDTDRRLKETGHQNAYFPMMIPESLLQKEVDHFEGFAPEVYWITHAGEDELAERLVVRPTSETIINTMYSKWIQTYRDLPLLINQWCTVFRREKTTRPFLRTVEFFWQEGHTVHETYEDAQRETLMIQEMYRQIIEEELAIPLVVGKKSDSERFAGADATYTLEAMMYDGKSLQAGTSHNLGQNFTKMFDIQYQDREGKLAYGWTTSWAITTRLIGALIMVHGDDRGMVMPPRIAPIQTVIVPIALHKEGVKEKAQELYDSLKGRFAVKLDDREQYSPGWKFNQWELKGVPLRIEIGPKDIEKNQVVFVRRDTNEKIFVSMDNLADKVDEMLETIQKDMFAAAKARMDANTFVVTDYEEFKEKMANGNPFIKGMWCGDEECEAEIKDETTATIRCIPFEEEQLSGTCIHCGKPAKHMVYYAKSY